MRIFEHCLQVNALILCSELKLRNTKIFILKNYTSYFRILDAIGAPYETFNILEDNDVRSGMKVFSSWPTFPQLYVNKEFVGGSDIMVLDINCFSF